MAHDVAYLYSHVFSVSLTPPEPVPYPIFIRAGEPTAVTQMVRRWIDPYGSVNERVISADTIAEQIAGICGNVGVIRIRGPKPTQDEIQQSMELARQHAIRLLQSWATITEFARTRGSSPGATPAAVIEAARFVHRTGMDVGRFGLPKSVVEIVLSEAGLGEELEKAADELIQPEAAKPKGRPKKPIAQPAGAPDDFRIDDLNI